MKRMAGFARRLHLDRQEAREQWADVGVLVPVAVALIVGKGLSATAVLLPPALVYLAVAFVYRLPDLVQPRRVMQPDV